MIRSLFRILTMLRKAILKRADEIGNVMLFGSVFLKSLRINIQDLCLSVIEYWSLQQLPIDDQKQTFNCDFRLVNRKKYTYKIQKVSDIFLKSLLLQISYLNSKPVAYFFCLRYNASFLVIQLWNKRSFFNSINKALVGWFRDTYISLCMPIYIYICIYVSIYLFI